MQDFFKGLNWICVLGIVILIEQSIGQGTVSLTNLIPESWIPVVKGWCTLLAFVGTTIMTYGSYGARPPLPAPKLPMAATIALLVGAGLLAMLLAPGDANAQAKKAPIFTGNLISDVKANISNGNSILTPQQLLDGIAQVNLGMLKYAKAQAKAANNNVTLPCWSAWVDLISTAQKPLLDDDGQPLAKPDPNLFGDLESASELLQALQPGGSIQVGCGAMADATKKSVLQIVSAVVTGNGLVGLLPIPPIP